MFKSYNCFQFQQNFQRFLKAELVSKLRSFLANQIFSPKKHYDGNKNHSRHQWGPIKFIDEVHHSFESVYKFGLMEWIHKNKLSLRSHYAHSGFFKKNVHKICNNFTRGYGDSEQILIDKDGNECILFLLLHFSLLREYFKYISLVLTRLSLMQLSTDRIKSWQAVTFNHSD